MYRRIMLTLDGSELSRAAVPQALAIAQGSSTEVLVFQAIDSQAALQNRYLGESFEFTGGRPEAIAELAQSQHFILRDRAHTEVERVAEELRAVGIQVTTDVGEGPPGNAILDAANRHEVDAIVMATRGHGGLGREVVGSVAEYVLRHVGNRALILAGPRTATA